MPSRARSSSPRTTACTPSKKLVHARAGSEVTPRSCVRYALARFAVLRQRESVVRHQDAEAEMNRGHVDVDRLQGGVAPDHPQVRAVRQRDGAAHRAYRRGIVP